MNLNAIAARVDRNAVLYKDVTQWLRHGLFMGLTFGLLLLGLCILYLATGVATKPGEAGPLALANIFRALTVYMLAVAAYGYRQAQGELRSGTLELFAMSGMTSDEVIMGKLGSMMAQALFGVCALAPFMFFAYLLRGADFIRIVAATVMLLLWQPPLHLAALGLAYWTARSRVYATMAAVVGAAVILLAAIGALTGMRSSFAASHVEFARGAGLIAREMLSMQANGLVFLFGGGFFYFIVCFILFIFCKVGLDGSLRAFVFAEWMMTRKLIIPSDEEPDRPAPDELRRPILKHS